MDKNKIIKNLVQILNKIRPIKNSQKNVAELNFITSGYLDSLEIIKFNMAIEYKFKIKIKFTTLVIKKYNTISGLASLIKKKLI
jgi:acyl carrier protein